MMLRISPEIAKLATALAKAQGEIEDATKDKTNPHFKSRYADLASVRAAIRQPLSNNGLAYVQLLRTSEHGLDIETLLMHGESGEMIGDTLTMPLGQFTPQAVGSAASYGRRYSLMALLGMAADDDDGNAAQEAAPRNGHGPRPRRTREEISANARRKTADHDGVVADLADIHSLAALDRYEREHLTPQFMSGLGNAQYLVEQWVAKRREELSEPAEDEPQHWPETKAGYVLACHDRIAEFTDPAAMSAWWNSDEQKAARIRYGLSAQELADLKSRVMERRDELKGPDLGYGRDVAGNPTHVTDAG